MTQPLRLGRIDFVNILPVHLHLEADEALYGQVRGVPSALNRMLRSGELDLGVVSSVEYALHAENYLLLPGLSISSDGPVGSVMLFSQLPMDQWAGRAVEAPFESNTSVALAKVLMHRLWRLDCPLRGEGEDPGAAAFLRIGDRALTEAASGRWAHVWDMGQQWKQLTGLPFVFAVWAVRRQVADQRRHDVSRLHLMLREARRRGEADLTACAAEAHRILGGSPSAYLRYYNLLRFGLGPLFRQGLSQFYEFLAQLGVIDQAPELEFFA